MKSADLISVATFRSRAEAQTAKTILDVAGIESVIHADPQWDVSGGADSSRDSRDGRYPHADYAQLMVRVEDADSAAQALSTR